ncbi:M13 family metallopeptidase [Sphingomonas sp. ID0503]|uniref:M13 family metallopeptidase n=1 Tax=Sphingomonas sp. ID0503 TaxID=3399691 RepID=UPI003AFA7420
MKTILALLASTMIAGTAFAQTTPDTSPAKLATPKYGDFGFDTAGMDKGVKPGDDFYHFANGAWEKNTPIPADRSNYGLFTVLDELSQARTVDILQTAAARPGSKIGDLYASYVDEAAVEAKGLTPLKPTLAKIAAIKDKGGAAAAFGATRGWDPDGLYGEVITLGPVKMQVQLDDKNPDQPIVSVKQGNLFLPDRDYYLESDPKLVEAKTAAAAYLTQLFTLAGEKDGAARAQAILDFEAKLAKVWWTRTESRDADKTYNIWTRADFDRNAPGLDWTAFLKAAGFEGQQRFLIAQPSAITGAAKAIADTPLAVLKDYAWALTLDDAALYLSKPFVDARFAYRDKALNGTPEDQPRWKRGVYLVKTGMADELGQVYVQKWFPPETKAAADQLIRNILAAWKPRLEKLAWMSPETKAKALQKLAAFTPKIGYPEKWRDYSTLVVKRDDLIGNYARAKEATWAFNAAKLGKPADRSEWQMTPMEINAYANPVWNEIVFPAAILQAPFFDPKADPAVNYGGIGAVIGHELSHHFDDQGRKYDPTGRLADWWTPADVTRFTSLTDKLVAQYDAYEPLPGEHVKGALTLGENIADLAGLTVAYDAYKLSLGGRPAAVIDGYTGDQRFYLGWAQVWRRSYRENNLRSRLKTDPHSPSAERAAVVRNLDPWYDAFKPKAGEKLYLAPDGRVRIW